MKKTATLHLADLNGAQKVIATQSVAGKMTNNSNFSNPNPFLPNAVQDADWLKTALGKAEKGSEDDRKTARVAEEKLDKSLTALVAYVTLIADGDESVIISAGMDVKKTGGKSALVFNVQNGDNSGDAVVQCPSLKHAAYVWQQSSDGVTWQTVKITSNLAEITVSGLTPGQKYYFRYASVQRDVQSDWSDALSIIAI